MQTNVLFHFQHGREYNETPARKLSQSFGLDMVGGKAITAKQVKIMLWFIVFTVK